MAEETNKTVRRIGDFTKVPYWNDTDAIPYVVADLIGVDFTIKKHELGMVEGQEENYKKVAVLAELADGKLIKFLVFSKVLYSQLESIPEDVFPLLATIKQEGAGAMKYFTFE